MYKYIHPGTIKQGYLIKSPPLEKRGLKVSFVSSLLLSPINC